MSNKKGSVYSNYINGEWVAPNAGQKTFKNLNPSDTREFEIFPQTSEKDVVGAVSSARRAQKEWRKVSWPHRAEVLQRASDLIKKDLKKIAATVTWESGKAPTEALADVIEAIHMIDMAVGWGRREIGHIMPSEVPTKSAMWFRKPKGVIAVITPWNFPFAIPWWAIAPALLGGNSVVFKPASETPRSGHYIAEYLDKAGLPKGVFNLVHGDGTVGSALSKADVDVVYFTGSSEVGQKIRKICAEHPHKMAVCEMGAKNALLVCADADKRLALKAGILSVFRTGNQRCVSSGKIYIDTALYDWFCDEFVKIAKGIKFGNPNKDASVFYGPQINKGARDKVVSYNELAKSEGAEVLLDAFVPDDEERKHGWFISPFVYKMKQSDARVLKEEVFGPHVALIPVSNLEQAVDYYNDTEFGLSVGVITESRRNMAYVRDNADYGLMYWNLPTIGAEVQLPFGGVKASGTGSPAALTILDAFTHRVANTYNESDDIVMAQGLSADI